MKPTSVIVGAGSVEFTRELLGDILSFPELGSVRIVLHDIDVERLETAEAIARATARAAGAQPEVVASADRRRAHDGADYVINVIQVGMHQATVRDFEIPAKYGLNQTIADTIGVGGIFRGLRTFPVLADIARDMEQVCPDAWLLNYTNPMAMNVTFLHHVAPRLKVLGLCHSVYWTMVGLCELVDVPYDDVSYWSAGVNHQAWVLRWERGGRDLYPLLDQRIASDAELRRRVRVDSTDGWATTPPRRVSIRASTSPGTCAIPTRSTGCGSVSVSTSPSARRTWPNTAVSEQNWPIPKRCPSIKGCLLYTSDAADD